ncbi:hypothetical protein [Cellulomonas endophytica]|uniref:hypothetical protein n=1 Tax=Cellulomonas endophytica TaxID=2494735 RepID=UPI001010CCE4|nr:hypothetical protein [Cellulomonas endophytica]
MSGASLASPTARAVDAVRRLPPWGQALAVWAATRVVSTVLLLVAASRQEAVGAVPARPSYWQATGLLFDGDWYRRIAEEGYPASLPVGADGLVQQNAWAFYPLFPGLVRLVMEVTRGPWEVVAPLTATALGAAAAVVVRRCVERGAPRACAARPGLPLVAVLLVGVFPTAPVLGVAYTESLALLLVAATLLLLVERRYGAAALAVLLLGLTRSVAPPVAAVVLVHAVVRVVAARRGREALRPRDVGGLLGLGAVTAVSAVAWPAVCGLVVGEADAYLQTQGAWRGVREVTPFGAIGYASRFWLGDWAVPGVAAAVALLAAAVLVPAAWRLGPELHAWPAAYVVYLAAVVEPGSSLARFLLLAFPLAAVTGGLVTGPPWARRLALAAVVALSLALQVVWTLEIWVFTPPADWPP